MTDNYVAQGASGHGLATVAENGVVLDSWFAETTLQSVTEISETRYLSASEAQTQFQLATPDHDAMRQVRSIAIHTTIADLRQPPRDLHDLYLRLHLLSQRKIKPWQANLAGFTELLIDVAWTSHGPCLPEQLSPGSLRNIAVEIYLSRNTKRCGQFGKARPVLALPDNIERQSRVSRLKRRHSADDLIYALARFQAGHAQQPVTGGSGSHPRMRPMRRRNAGHDNINRRLSRQRPHKTGCKA